MPIGENKFEIKKTKAEGFLDTIDTLRNMNAEGSRRYAVLSFCDLILNELESKNESVDLDSVRQRISNLREEVGRDNNHDGEEELLKIIEDIKNLVRQN